MKNPENLNLKLDLKPGMAIDSELALNIHENNFLKYVENYEQDQERELELVSHIDRNSEAFKIAFDKFLSA